MVVSVIALPLAIAFGVAAFSPLGPAFIPIGAVAGLTGAIFTGFFASLFGGCPSQVTGPTGPMSVVTKSTIATVIATGFLHKIPQQDQIAAVILIFSITIIMGGLVEIILGITRTGKLIKFIPYSVLAGFMNGIAVIIFISQIKPFLGVTSQTRWSEILTIFHTKNILIIGVGVVTVLSMVLLPIITKRIPSSLFALISGVVAYLAVGYFIEPSFLSLQNNSLIIGPIPNVLPKPVFFLHLSFFALFDLDIWKLMIQQAIIIGLLGAIDTLLTSVIADLKTKEKHNSNRELIGQGIGNVLSGLFGGLPGAGATVRTVCNIDAGGKTKIAGMVHSIILLFVLIFLGVFAQWIPMSVLAGILLVTAVKMIDIWSFKLISKKSVKEDVLIMLAVTIITVLVDLIIAVGIGLLLAFIVFIKSQIASRVVRSIRYGNVMRSRKLRSDVANKILNRHGREIIVVELEGSVFFGTVDRFSEIIEKEIKVVQEIILDMRHVQSIDLTGGQMLKELVDHILKTGKTICLSGLMKKSKFKNMLDELEILRSVGEEHLFIDIDLATEACEDSLLIRHGHKATVSKKDTLLPLSELTSCQGLSDTQLEILSGYLVSRDFMVGDLVYSAGDVACEVYFIRRGEFSVLYCPSNNIDDQRRLITYGAGEHFGEIALFSEEPRSSSVTATEEGSLFVLTVESYKKLLKDHQAIFLTLTRNFAKRLSSRLRSVSAELVALEDE